eukprot:snap_masked-scaffold_16-processed-gene-1.56-mRNA-1 protein AED:1.00 eAED:1.00 QI:0/-1/0/0/-1/1/1/0/726
MLEETLQDVYGKENTEKTFDQALSRFQIEKNGLDENIRSIKLDIDAYKSREKEYKNKNKKKLLERGEKLGFMLNNEIPLPESLHRFLNYSSSTISKGNDLSTKLRSAEGTLSLLNHLQQGKTLLSIDKLDSSTISEFYSFFESAKSGPFLSERLEVETELFECLQEQFTSLVTEYKSVLIENLRAENWPFSLSKTLPEDIVFLLSEETLGSLSLCIELNKVCELINPENIRQIQYEAVSDIILKKFRYHFYGDKGTNKINKPEFFFMYMLDIVQTHFSLLAVFEDIINPDIFLQYIFKKTLLPKLNETLAILEKYKKYSLIDKYLTELVAFDLQLKTMEIHVPSFLVQVINDENLFAILLKGFVGSQVLSFVSGAESFFSSPVEYISAETNPISDFLVIFGEKISSIFSANEQNKTVAFTSLADFAMHSFISFHLPALFRALIETYSLGPLESRKRLILISFCSKLLDCNATASASVVTSLTTVFTENMVLFLTESIQKLKLEYASGIFCVKQWLNYFLQGGAVQIREIFNNQVIDLADRLLEQFTAHFSSETEKSSTSGGLTKLGERTLAWLENELNSMKPEVFVQACALEFIKQFSEKVSKYLVFDYIGENTVEVSHAAAIAELFDGLEQMLVRFLSFHAGESVSPPKVIQLTRLKETSAVINLADQDTSRCQEYLKEMIQSDFDGKPFVISCGEKTLSFCSMTPFDVYSLLLQKTPRYKHTLK